VSVPINHYEIRKDGWAIFTLPKWILVFSHAEIKRASRRGKQWRRHGNLKLSKREGHADQS